MKRKGQAAMEFLMTYGWAILAAIIVIAVLAIYFRPSGFVSGQSRLNAPFTLLGANVGAGAAGPVNLDFRNDAQDTIDVAVDGIRVCLDAGCSIACTNSGNAGYAGALTDIAVGDTSGALVLECNAATTAGVDYKGDITIDYTLGASTVAQRATGLIAGKAV